MQYKLQRAEQQSVEVSHQLSAIACGERYRDCVPEFGELHGEIHVRVAEPQVGDQHDGQMDIFRLRKRQACGWSAVKRSSGTGQAISSARVPRLAQQSYIGGSGMICLRSFCTARRRVGHIASPFSRGSLYESVNGPALLGDSGTKLYPKISS